ncbi:hypothetical protein [Polaromonas naphthalenivorans]|uniref:Uncharacterized protein n=1 Tax=Polaromonas naphthalenivorans (strain CJ2) TaxID=365044 RepID=A1VPE0_POLNA|nr:hypothetical protein [Polaromonas naphthalenivorans]ABM37518.1 hypothetical protein Pnap_2210 [Polaromonas naphthalenivorans CJ2]MBH2008762.1 hypothetical protein [Xanthomonadaceae bacterium]
MSTTQQTPESAPVATPLPAPAPVAPAAPAKQEAAPVAVKRTRSPAKKVAAEAAPVTPAPLTKPAVKKAAVRKTPVKKVAAKAIPPQKTAAKAPAVKAVAAAKPEKTAAPHKAKKDKLVRDSFTIPKTEYAVIDELKQRAAKLNSAVKKSELLRAGIKMLASLSDAALLTALAQVPTIKTGRPALKK